MARLATLIKLVVSLPLLAPPAGALGQVHRERGSQFIVSVGDDCPRFSYVEHDDARPTSTAPNESGAPDPMGESDGGDVIDTDFLRGQVVMLQFCASWCPFSQAQLVDEQWRIARRYGRNPDLRILLVCEDTPADRPEFLRQRAERGIDMPLTFDDGERIYRQFVTPNGSVTRTVLVDRRGVIAALYDVHTRMTRYQIRRDLRRMLRHKE